MHGWPDCSLPMEWLRSKYYPPSNLHLRLFAPILMTSLFKEAEKIKWEDWNGFLDRGAASGD
jgi:hypothetical protein